MGTAAQGDISHPFGLSEHKAELQQPNSKFQAKEATEIPNKVLITESFRLEKTSEIEFNH